MEVKYAAGKSGWSSPTVVPGAVVVVAAVVVAIATAVEDVSEVAPRGETSATRNATNAERRDTLHAIAPTAVGGEVLAAAVVAVAAAVLAEAVHDHDLVPGHVLTRRDVVIVAAEAVVAALHPVEVPRQGIKKQVVILSFHLCITVTN